MTWEDTVVSLEPQATRAYSDRPAVARQAFVRICTHYFAHAAWLEEGALIRGAVRLVGIPGVLIHGRLDLSSPLETAWELTQAWPEARLVVVHDAGHLGQGATADHVRQALAEFAEIV